MKLYDIKGGNTQVTDIIYNLEEVNCIYNATLGQNTNPTWKEMRKGIITASNFKRVYTRSISMEKNPDAKPDALLRHLLGDNKPHSGPVPAALKWGHDHEEKARSMYTQVEKKKHRRLQVDGAGLLLDVDCPYLGCSADGVVSCHCKTHDRKLIEIKCPYALRDKSPKDAAKERGCIKRDGKWLLKPSSDYYTQIQGQLGIHNLKVCDLVVYTTKGIHVIPVNFDQDFFDDLKKRLTQFFTKHMFPALLAEWKGD